MIAIQVITTPNAFKDMLHELTGAELLSLDFETTGLDPYTSKILLMSLYEPIHDIAYVLDFTALPIELLKQLKPILESKRVIKIGHNLTFEWKQLYHAARIEMVHMHDVMICDRMLFAGLRYKHDLKTIIARRLHITVDKEIRKTFIGTTDTVFTKEQLEYSAMDSVYPVAIYKQQLIDIQEKQLDRIYALEMSILPITALMEYTGVYINRSMLEEMVAPFEHFVRLADKALQDLFIAHGAAEIILFTKDGYSCLNSGSSEQVGEALARLGIEVKNSAGKISLGSKLVQRWDMINNKKKGTKRYKDFDIDYHELIDDEEVADALDLYLGLENPFLRAYTFLNGARKLLSTYVYGILEAINPVTKRVHPYFNSYGAEATGRYSSNSPNFQNLPNDKKLKILGLGLYSLRKCLEAAKGRKFIISDYSGIELLILAVLADDDKLLEMILRGDIHTTVTIEVLGYDKITLENKKKDPHKLWRDGAKTLSYAIAYGTTGRNVAETLNIMLASQGFKIDSVIGDSYIEKWFRLFPKTAAFLKSMADHVEKKGFVTDVWGRRRHWDISTFANKWKRLAARREGQNMPIQSSSATMTKRALALIWDKLNRKKARVIICVHDEIVIESTDDYLETAKQIVKECMEQAIRETLPKVADLVGLHEGTSVSPQTSDRYDK